MIETNEFPWSQTGIQQRQTPGEVYVAMQKYPQVALAEPSAGGGGQQRPAQLPPLPDPGSLRPGGQVGIQGRHGAG